jgi:DNA-binding GntR family transcriptional regulator
MEMKQKRPRTDPAALAALVRTAIQNGSLVPGQRLVEIDLMNRYEVSRACVRDALRQLETERLVEIVKNQGAFVRRVTRAEVLQILDVLDELSVLTLRQVAANVNETGVRNAVTGALKAAERFRARLDRSLPVSSYVEETNRLWNTLTRSAGNVILEETHSSLQALLHRIRLSGLVFRGRENRWVSWHVEMLEAVLAGSAARAVKLMRNAARESRLAIMALPDDAFG